MILFLFSDVSENDAPTIIEAGSHLTVAEILEIEGENDFHLRKWLKDSTKYRNAGRQPQQEKEGP